MIAALFRSIINLLDPKPSGTRSMMICSSLKKGPTVSGNVRLTMRWTSRHSVSVTSLAAATAAPARKLVVVFKRTLNLCIACFLPAILSCDSEEWPTEQASLLETLEQERSTFLAIESQMRLDNLRVISESFLHPPDDGDARSMAHLIALVKRDDYLELMPPDSPYIYRIFDDAFSVWIPSSETHTTRYSVWLRRDTNQIYGDSCDSRTMEKACGTCAMQIDDEWSAHWAWPLVDWNAMDIVCPDDHIDD